jgi:hypothetical protein
MEMFQLNLFNSGATLLKDKVVELVSYKKAYFTDAYDREKYMAIFAAYKKLCERYKRPDIMARLNPYREVRKCFVYEGDVVKSMGDQKHIYRIKTLHKIQRKIYETIGDWVGDKPNKYLKKEYPTLDFWVERYKSGKYEYKGKKYNGKSFLYYGAEIKNTWNLPLKLRVQKHIELLRKLRADQERITNQTPLAKAL